MAKDKTDKAQCFVVEGSGIRLDRYVVEKFPEISRTQIQKLIEGGYVLVNGRIAKAGLKLDTGDNVSVVVPGARFNQSDCSAPRHRWRQCPLQWTRPSSRSRSTWYHRRPVPFSW